MKKPYTPPVVVEYGRIEQLTLGCSNGNSDWGHYKAIGDATPGNPSNGGESCPILPS